MNDAEPPANKVFSTKSWILVALLLVVCIILVIMLQFREITDLDVWLFHEVREQYETSLKAFVRVFTELGSVLVWFLVVTFSGCSARNRRRSLFSSRCFPSS